MTVVPFSEPLDGVMVIELEAEVNTLPRESSTLTTTAGEIEVVAVTLLGWTVKASLFASPAEMIKEPLLALVRPVALAVNE